MSDAASSKANDSNAEVHLTPTEFAILEVLALSVGRPVANARIAARVWKGASPPSGHRPGPGRRPSPQAGARPSNPRYIVTEPWIGYRFAAEPLA